MTETRMKNLSRNDAFFYKIKKDQLDGVCILHIDDLLITGSKEFHKEVTRMLKEFYTDKVNERHIRMETKTDNQILYDTPQNIKQIEEKGIRYLIAWIKEQVEDKTAEKMEWVPDKEMNANVCTKNES